MILRDENIPLAQRQLLRGWRVRGRQIGVDVAHKGIQDEAIIPLLHSIGRVSFFTRDLGFFKRSLVHRTYCLVCMDVSQYDVAHFVRRFIHHASFSKERQRDGSVVRIGHQGIACMRPRGLDEILTWDPG